MKKISLATALYLSTAALAFADSNSLIVTQASVGAGAPSLNFTQSGSGALASVIQNGNDTLTGVQVGTGGTKLNVDQENPTAGAVNTIGYTGRGNSNVTIDQRASNGVFTASGSAGNTANVDMQGNGAAGGTANKLFLDQVGFNNNAIINDAFAGYAPSPTNFDNIQVAQYSDTAAAGNQFQNNTTGIGAGGSTTVVQKGGNKANFAFTAGGGQFVTLSQTNSADNIASANVANLTFIGADFQWTQTGTTNNVQGSLGGTSVNGGIKGFQNGNGNIANLTQVSSYISTLGGDVVDQTGNNNTVVTKQTNTHESTYLIQQQGNLNQAFATQTGTSDTATLQQTGNSNNGQVTQSGTSNVAQLIQAGNSNIGSITQSGTGASAIIHQN